MTFALTTKERQWTKKYSGVVLADEVGLGKTIEASIVLCRRWKNAWHVTRRLNDCLLCAGVWYKWVTKTE